MLAPTHILHMAHDRARPPPAGAPRHAFALTFAAALDSGARRAASRADVRDRGEIAAAAAARRRTAPVHGDAASMNNLQTEYARSYRTPYRWLRKEKRYVTSRHAGIYMFLKLFK
ncbi:hypothetical protein EVAR_50636_1 [Eumeta japonica]|uniref:Uncharacterized protein n=1 Tax=Eumeta variegata TaxID=151549 RepID=A0A4C1XKK6_EUMVA|nr:hypothetical protein EVAR_50636_1 [Eumeta japonica]